MALPGTAHYKHRQHKRGPDDDILSIVLNSNH